jgi:hypothetical protein
MYISEKTANYVIQLIQKTFQLNAFLDNCVYNLDYMKYENTQKILHEKFAHTPPIWADMLSDILNTQNVRVIRLGLEDENKEYSNIYDVFSDILSNFIVYRESVKNCIEVAEFENDIGIKITLEEYYNMLNIWFKQVQIWATKASELSECDFDVHFSDFCIV